MLFNRFSQRHLFWIFLLVSVVGSSTCWVNCFGDAPGNVDLSKVNSFNAAKSGNLEIVKRLVKHDPKIAHHTNKLGRTMLHYAAEGNQPEVIRFLIKNGADPNKMGTFGTPLHITAQVGPNCYDAAKTLIENGADPKARILIYWQNPKKRARYEKAGLSIKRQSVLEMAAHHGHVEVVELLLKKMCLFKRKIATWERPLYIMLATHLLVRNMG